MVQQIVTTYVSDISGLGGIGGPDVETVYFGLADHNYEIDLTIPEAAAMREKLKKFVEYARKVSNTSSSRPATGQRPKPDAVDNAAVRAWANEQGIDVKPTGRVPAKVVAAYQEAMQASN